MPRKKSHSSVCTEASYLSSSSLDMTNWTFNSNIWDTVIKCKFSQWYCNDNPPTRSQEKFSPGSLVGSRNNWKVYIGTECRTCIKQSSFYRYWHGFWNFVKIHTEVFSKVGVFFFSITGTSKTRRRFVCSTIAAGFRITFKWCLC